MTYYISFLSSDQITEMTPVYSWHGNNLLKKSPFHLLCSRFLVMQIDSYYYHLRRTTNSFRVQNFVVMNRTLGTQSLLKVLEKKI